MTYIKYKVNLPIGYDRVVGEKHEKDFNNRALFIQVVKDAQYNIRQKELRYLSNGYREYNIKQYFDDLKEDETYTIRRINLENKNKENLDRLLTKKEKLEKK